MKMKKIEQYIKKIHKLNILRFLVKSDVNFLCRSSLCFIFV